MATRSCILSRPSPPSVARRPSPETNTEVLHAEADDVPGAIQNDRHPFAGGVPGDIAETFFRHFINARTDFAVQLLGYVPARQARPRCLRVWRNLRSRSAAPLRGPDRLPREGAADGRYGVPLPPTAPHGVEGCGVPSSVRSQVARRCAASRPRSIASAARRCVRSSCSSREIRQRSSWWAFASLARRFCRSCSATFLAVMSTEIPAIRAGVPFLSGIGNLTVW